MKTLDVTTEVYNSLTGIANNATKEEMEKAFKFFLEKFYEEGDDEEDEMEENASEEETLVVGYGKVFFDQWIRQQTARKIIIRTTLVDIPRGWMKLHAKRAGYDCEISRYEEWERKHQFSDCYVLTKI